MTEHTVQMEHAEYVAPTLLGAKLLLHSKHNRKTFLLVRPAVANIAVRVSSIVAARYVGSSLSALAKTKNDYNNYSLAPQDTWYPTNLQHNTC